MGCRLLRRRKRDVAAAEVEAIGSGGGGIGDDLEGVGTGHVLVADGGGVKDFVAGDVHDDDAVTGDEAEAVGTGGEDLIADFEMNLVEEIALVALLDGGGVAGGVDERREDEGAVGEADSGGVAALDGGALPLVVDGGGHDRRCLLAVEHADFGLGGRCSRRLREGSGAGGDADWAEHSKCQGVAEGRGDLLHGVIIIRTDLDCLQGR